MRERDLVPLYTFSAFYLVQKFVKSSCFLCDPLEFLSSYCKSKSLAFIRLSHSSVIATLGGRGGGGGIFYGKCMSFYGKCILQSSAYI